MTEPQPPTTGAQPDRPSIPRPADEQVVLRAADVVGAERRRSFDVLATIAGALAALGTLLLLSSLVGTIGTVGFQRGVEGRSLGIGGLVAGLVVLLVACLVGGWVAGRVAGVRGPLHGLVSVVWLVVLAGALALLAALVGDDADVRDRVGLPDWFSSDALGAAAVVSGVVALLLMLLGGWLGGRLAGRNRSGTGVEVVSTRREVHTRPGGITAEERR